MKKYFKVLNNETLVELKLGISKYLHKHKLHKLDNTFLCHDRHEHFALNMPLMCVFLVHITLRTEQQSIQVLIKDLHIK